jgi:putative flavoprotein involved in K+ transport
MHRTNTIIIGGGQAGLAMSRCLKDHGVDHVVLERGRVAERWRSERWDSLRLLTPNWQSRLPGFSYQGPQPDGFMTMPEVIGYLEDYARSFDAPILTGTTVTAVERSRDDYRVMTDRGVWHCDNVVVATGHCGRPIIPDMAERLPTGLTQLTPSTYRNPSQLPEGGVLVVGASASGIQLAHEIHGSGRPVTLAVGRHVRLPRSYRGRDIMVWLDAMGTLDQTIEDVFSVEASRNQPSLQLVGRTDHRSLDLGVLQEAGVRLVGRAADADSGTMYFSDDLAMWTAEAGAKLERILGDIDTHIAANSLDESLPPARPIRPVVPARAPTSLDLAAAGITTVVWAIGFSRSYPWLKVPVLDDRGEIRHDGGVTPAPGLFALGLNFMRRRKSTYIDGVGADAEELAQLIVERVNEKTPAAA